jgi:hypothetical protein
LPNAETPGAVSSARPGGFDDGNNFELDCLLVTVVLDLTNSLEELFSTRVDWFVVWGKVWSEELFAPVASTKTSMFDAIAVAELNGSVETEVPILLGSTEYAASSPSNVVFSAWALGSESRREDFDKLVSSS